jgi:hAT family C-terminal dimerisation region
MIQINRSKFPRLFAIAMDYLPIQALSVPCECVFSSAKETDTVKRNRIHPMLMEVLQRLKILLKKDRQSISFTNRWKTMKVEMMPAQKATKEDLFAQLLTGDCQATTNTLLNVLDDEEVELDSDN